MMTQTRQHYYCLNLDVYQKHGAFSYILFCDLTRTEGNKTGHIRIWNRLTHKLPIYIKGPEH